MKKQDGNKLRLGRETIAPLQLEEVVGGQGGAAPKITISTCSCIPSCRPQVCNDR